MVIQGTLNHNNYIYIQSLQEIMTFIDFSAFFAIVLATAHRVVVRLANKLVEVLGHVKGIKNIKVF